MKKTELRGESTSILEATKYEVKKSPCMCLC